MNALQIGAALDHHRGGVRLVELPPDLVAVEHRGRGVDVLGVGEPEVGQRHIEIERAGGLGNFVPHGFTELAVDLRLHVVEKEVGTSAHVVDGRSEHEHGNEGQGARRPAMELHVSSGVMGFPKERSAGKRFPGASGSARRCRVSQWPKLFAAVCRSTALLSAKRLQVRQSPMGAGGSGFLLI